jgi:type VI secretion system secreted protein Hcp
MPLAQMQPAQMPNAATVFYVDIKGAKQGQFKFDSSPKAAAQKGYTEAIKFYYQVTSPRDAATGLPTGQRQYSAITITKAWGTSSPQILTACATNEILPTVTFNFVKPNGLGQTIVYQTIKLTNATITSVKRHIDVSTGTEPPDPRELEDVSFTFQKIEVQDVNGTMAMDDWMGHP